MTRKLSTAVTNRLDAIVNSEPGTTAAIDALYDIFNRIERTDRDLHAQLTGAFLDALETVQSATWLDGWQCGRDPERLIFRDDSLRHPDPAVSL